MSENVLATTQPTTPAADEAHHGRSLNRFTTVLLIGYLAFIVAFMVLKRAAVTPDVFVVFVSVVAVMLGRGRTFVRDWAPFLLIFLAWEAMRGVANQFGASVQSDSIIAIERFVSFGIVPPVELQRLLHTPAGSALWRLPPPRSMRPTSSCRSRSRSSCGSSDALRTTTT